MSELLGCPMCRNKAQVMMGHTDDQSRMPTARVACCKCGTSTIMVTSMTDKAAVDEVVRLWNFRAVKELSAPVPLLLHCPMCQLRHVDAGVFAEKPHHTHACQGCGHVWRPAVVCTVGVQFLPGYKDKS